MMDLIHDMLEEDEHNEVEELKKFLKKYKQTRTVTSLRSTVIASIAKDIQFWMEGFPDNPSKYLYILSPFDVLSSNDTLDVMKELTKQKRFQQCHIHLLFHYNLHKMDFDIFSSYSVGDCCLKVLFNRCKDIKDLTISSKTKASQNTLNQIPVHYPQLEHLKIIKNICKAEFVDSLTMHCKNLKSLHLPHCSKLPKQTLITIQNLKSLLSLKLHHAINMNWEALNDILRSLTNLIQLSLIDCRLSFSKLNDHNIYDSIKVLDLSWSEITDRSVNAICVVMPNICDLCVSNCKSLTTLSFDYICKLKELRSLNVSYLSCASGSNSRRYDFDTRVEFCLLNVGLELTSLDLSGMSNVQTNIVAMSCPNLQRLYLNHCCYPKIDWIYQVNLRQSPSMKYNWLCGNRDTYSLLEVCVNIKVLHITCMYISEEELSKIFLGAKNLKELKFLPWTVDGSLSGEEFFLHFFSQFYFDQLQILDLTNATDKVGKQVVFLVLKMYPRLLKLRVIDCDLLEPELSVIQDLLGDAQLDMKIEVSCAHKNVSRVL